MYIFAKDLPVVKGLPCYIRVLRTLFIYSNEDYQKYYMPEWNQYTRFDEELRQLNLKTKEAYTHARNSKDYWNSNGSPVQNTYHVVNTVNRNYGLYLLS